MHVIFLVLGLLTNQHCTMAKRGQMIAELKPIREGVSLTKGNTK